MSTNENLPPVVVRLVAKELKTLNSESPEGIDVHFSEANFTDIQAVIHGPEDTPFSGGQFRVKLKLPSDFPSTPPRGYFLTKIFHPNVNPDTGEICVNTLKRDWKSDLGIKHILLTIKCLLIVPNPESALNEEAGMLLLENYKEYFARAKMMTEIHALPRPSIESASNAKMPLANHVKQKSVKDKKRTLKRL